MKGIDPALLTQLVTAIIAVLTGLGTLCVALASYFKSKANSAKLDASAQKLDENTKLTQAAVDNHADTITKLDSLATKVVVVTPSPLDKQPEKTV